MSVLKWTTGLAASLSLVALGTAAPALAQDDKTELVDALQDSYKAAVEAYQDEDYESSLSKFKPVAEAGSSNAQYMMGRHYYFGTGVEQDYAKAAQWYEKAAAQGHMDSQFNLGVIYRDGLGTDQAYDEAYSYFKAAGEQGHPNALFCSAPQGWSTGNVSPAVST